MRAMIYSLVMACLFSACQSEGSRNPGKYNSSNDTISLVAKDELVVDTTPVASEGSSKDRENWQKPQMVISRLGDLSVKTVADIGAGTGYFTMRLARKASKVIAIDIESQWLQYINRRLATSPDAEELNIETRLTVEDDPSLLPGEADLVLIVNTYPYIQDRVNYFQKVWSGIADHGRLVVIDFKKKRLPVGPPVEDKIPASYVVSQLDSVGFAPIEVDSSALDYQYIVTANKLPEATPTEPTSRGQSPNGTP